MPKSRQETHQALQQYQLVSNRGERMVHSNDEENGIIIFTTETNLALLCEDEVAIYGDGTFKVCPRYFYQLYTLHAYKQGFYVPRVFCLLPSKTKATYISMFQRLRELCAAQNLNFRVSDIHLDFETAVHQAVREVWPTAKVNGCLFHLGQAWWRKMQSLGLADDYKDQDSEIGRWLKTFFWTPIFATRGCT